jgi:hypothetical protein
VVSIRGRTADEAVVADDLMAGASTSEVTEYATTDVPCIVCVLSRELDEDRPKLGIVRWQVRSAGRLVTGVPVAFDCPNGHSSAEDPALLKAFRSRLF